MLVFLGTSCICIHFIVHILRDVGAVKLIFFTDTTYSYRFFGKAINRIKME